MRWIGGAGIHRIDHGARINHDNRAGSPPDLPLRGTRDNRDAGDGRVAPVTCPGALAHAGVGVQSGDEHLHDQDVEDEAGEAEQLYVVGPAATAREVCPFCQVDVLNKVVDPGYAADSGVYHAPNQPWSPDPPR